MKAKHRILAAGMAAAMTLSLAACGGSASTAEPAQERRRPGKQLLKPPAAM